MLNLNSIIRKAEKNVKKDTAEVPYDDPFHKCKYPRMNQDELDGLLDQWDAYKNDKSMPAWKRKSILKDIYETLYE